MGRFVLALAAILALDLFAADIVILKDGKTYEGTFAGATADHVTLQVDGHTKCRLAINEIQSIRFDRSRDTSPIEQKYNALEGSEIALGKPIGEERALPDGRGRYRLYQNGAIYYTPQTRAHPVHGAIGDRWLGAGAERRTRLSDG
jgi:uncharacterized protein with LGFP repeats